MIVNWSHIKIVRVVLGGNAGRETHEIRNKNNIDVIPLF